MPFYRPSRTRTIRRNKKRGRSGRHEREREKGKREREREGGKGEIIPVFLFSLTECVEILDGHTTNKRDPSDDIELRSAGVAIVGQRT